MLEQHIKSFIDGRIRVRHPALCHEKNIVPLHELLDHLPGMNKVTINSRTGSLLLEYDPSLISREDLLSLASHWEPVDTDEEPVRRKKESPVFTRAQIIRHTNRGMLLSLAVSVGLAAMGRERGHIVAGGIFLLFNALHLHTFRKCL